jgi:hypothetical protein
MTSLPGRFAVTLAIALCSSLCGCGESATPIPEGPFAPGISGAALAGRVEVIVIDEETRELLPQATIAIGAADGSTLFTREDAPGFAAIEDARIAGAISVRVTTAGAWAGVTTWAGVAADRVVVAVPRRAGRAIDGRVAGADTLGAADVLAGPLETPRFTSFGALDRAAPSACAMLGDGSCRFTGVASESASRAVAIVRDASGAPIAFGVGPLAVDGTADISLLDESMRAPVVELALGASLPMPPPGLDAVVGVPGLATAEGIGLLPQTPGSDGSLGVPELAGPLADASWWVLLEARSADGSARSVVVQRGIRDPGGVGTLPELLAPPAVTVTSGGEVQIAEVAGASLFVVECASAETTLVLDLAAAPALGPCDGRLRVRAIDAPGASGAALDLDTVDRTAQRFSETTRGL